MKQVDPLMGYRQRFPGIQMRLHLERIPADMGRISVTRIRDAQKLGPLLTSYRATARAVEVRMANPFSRPMSIAEVAGRLSQFTPENQQAFQAYRSQFAQAGEPVRLEAPAYHLGDAGYLLLDGNHRVAALFMAGVPFELNLVALHGPVDRRILVDLKYWDGGLARFLNRIRWGTSAGKVHPARHLP